MDNRDIAGEQIRELGQKQRRPQIIHQPFVEEGRRRVAFDVAVNNGQIDGDIALAAAGRDDHIHPPEDFLITFHAGRIQRQPGGIGADALPGLHLALIPLFGDLRVKLDGRPGVNDVGREALFIDIDALRIERFPMRVEAFAERGGDTNAGDPDFHRTYVRGFRLSHAA
jgi:hypothetical protein